jgi:hypothetical protein
MWRVGFNTTVNWTDNEQFCGGFGVSLKRLLFFEICMDNLGVDEKCRNCRGLRFKVQYTGEVRK